jgi:hypothetical protein
MVYDLIEECEDIINASGLCDSFDD